MRGILEAYTDTESAATHVRIAAPGPDLLKPGHDSFRSELTSYKEHFAPKGTKVATAAAALRRGGKLALACAWLYGEASLAKETCKVVKEWGVPRTNVLFPGYYRRR